MIRPSRSVIAVTVALAALLTPATPAGAAAHHHRASHRHRPSHHHSNTGIPQHNGGDHDVDNNGGPSDGDGNV
jgi:hypothetical protein